MHPENARSALVIANNIYRVKISKLQLLLKFHGLRDILVVRVKSEAKLQLIQPLFLNIYLWNIIATLE